MKFRVAFLSAAFAALMSSTVLPGQAVAETVVTMTVGQIFKSIDPAKITDYTDYMAAVNLYDALVSVDSEGRIIPELAESWEVSSDAKEVTYKIREDAKFNDGSPVEATDVVYSVERLLRVNQGPASLFADVLSPGSVTAVDAKTVKFTLSKTFAPFLSIVPTIFILNKDVVEANAGSDDGQTYLSANVAGAGAYNLKTFDRGSQLVVVRNKDYYKGFGEGPIDEVRWVIVNDEASVRAMAASGELTMTGPFQSPDTYKALGQMERMRLQTDPTTSSLYLKLNSKVAPTDDVHIRKAIALATDYATIRDVILPGEILKTPLPGTFAEYLADDIPEPRYDLEAAKAEVAKSKYAGSTPIPITLGYLTGIKYQEEISLLMQANLEQIGFKVKQEVNPWNRVTELATKVETTPAVNQIFFSATYPSPDSIFYAQYHSKAAGTWASMEWLQNPEIDKLIEDARGAGDKAKQIEIYKELQHKLVDMQSDVFLLTQITTHAVDKCLTGLTIVPMRSFGYDFTRLSWTCK
ncbi:MAG TPA: ABC transporter substrate-binding protein [Rhizobiaceae bacterium]|nr:ABC transporter substrate-binding protein [Rhizobiaceae bacterium]